MQPRCLPVAETNPYLWWISSIKMSLAGRAGLGCAGFSWALSSRDGGWDSGANLLLVALAGASWGCSRSSGRCHPAHRGAEGLRAVVGSSLKSWKCCCRLLQPRASGLFFFFFLMQKHFKGYHLCDISVSLLLLVVMQLTNWSQSVIQVTVPWSPHVFSSWLPLRAGQCSWGCSEVLQDAELDPSQPRERLSNGKNLTKRRANKNQGVRYSF